MKATLLASKPTSGIFPEMGWASASRRNLWVHFDTAEPWVGVFAAGGSHYSCVQEFRLDEDPCLVIAGGQGYVVDVGRRALVRKTTWDGVCTAASVPGADSIVVADYTSVWLDRPDGTSPTTGRAGWQPLRSQADQLALDGIVLDEVSGQHVRGRAWWYDGWHAFALDLASLTFKLEEVLAEVPHERSGLGPDGAQLRSLLLP